MGKPKKKKRKRKCTSEEHIHKELNTTVRSKKHNIKMWAGKSTGLVFFVV